MKAKSETSDTKAAVTKQVKRKKKKQKECLSLKVL